MADEAAPALAGDPNARLDPSQSMRPSLLAADAALNTFKAWFKADAQHSNDWRKRAKENFAFVANEQWSKEDEMILRDQKRVPITFNRTLTMIKAVAGMEINGRHEITFLPRNLEDAKINETLTGASKWMADNCDGEDEESEAFQHTLICGMGWNEHLIEFDEDPEGKYVEPVVDPLEMYWDRTAKKKNLTDARRLAHLRKMPLGDAMQMFPNFTRAELDASWALGQEPNEPVKTLEERRVRDENSSGPAADDVEVSILRLQWWERETYWIVADPVENKKIELSDDEYHRLKARMDEFRVNLVAAQMKRKVYKQAFIGAKILEMGDGPLPDRFSFTCVTGMLHHIKRTWFGLVDVLRDPQMWANKWLSQTLHILNSTAKGGIIAETSAFEDQRQAEENYAKPEGIVWAKKDALSGQHGPKIIPKPGAGNFSGYFDLLQMAINATRDVSGINLELLGQKDVNQPGILEAQRKQAGMTVLATMFDALRRARKQIGRIRLYFIQNFLSDGRLIRIVGQDGAKVIPLLRDKCLGEYDVIVDDTPTSPNQKQANWAIISSLLPAFKDQLMARPDLFMKVLQYSPLPQQLVEDIAAAIENPPPNQDQEQAKQLAIAERVAKINRDQAAAEKDMAAAGSTQATAAVDVAMAQHLYQKDAKANELEAAKVETERATADHLRAKTAGEHADAVRNRVGAMIDALSPIPHQPPRTSPGPPTPALAHPQPQMGI